MKQYLRLLGLSLLMLSGRGVASAESVNVKVGEYITTSESTTTGTIKNNDNGGLGSIYKTATASSISSAMMTSKAHNQL